MKTIKVKFADVTVYEVEFEVEDNDEVDEENWFDLMDVAKPKWLTQSRIIAAEDRQLIELDIPNELGVSK